MGVETGIPRVGDPAQGFVGPSKSETFGHFMETCKKLGGNLALGGVFYAVHPLVEGLLS